MHHATHKHEQKQEMDNIHIHFPTNTQGHKHIQKHKLYDSIQMPKYHSQPYQTSQGPRHYTPQ